MPRAAKIIVAGDAQGRESYVNELNAQLAEWKLQETVAIVGHVGQMATAFAASDIAVFPVIEPEAFGRGAVEAQAMGVPVIASNLGGFSETVVAGETGMLTPAGDADALAEAMQRMIATGSGARREMGQRGQRRARALYSKETLQAATLAVYRKLLAESAHPGGGHLQSESGEMA
jgi:glycosyltransferase involved in cell wall biosynthesis